MPYTTPPTFADDSILSASQLNTLSDDIEFLYSVGQAPNIPFQRVDMGLEPIDAINYYIRHAHQYLVIDISVGIDTPAYIDFEVTYGATESLSTNPVYEMQFVDDADEGNYTIVVDLETGIKTATSDGDAYTNAGHIEPTVGEFYTLYVECDKEGDTVGSSFFTINAIYESETDPTA